LTINSSQGLRQAAVNGMGIIMLADALVQPDTGTSTSPLSPVMRHSLSASRQLSLAG
jgi:DNA-binding transcriptional LysR family regulator